MRKHLASTLALAATTFGALALPAGATRVDGAAQGGVPRTTSLTGAQEVPVPGDPDGTGSALLTVNLGQGQLCYEMHVAGIEPATAAHIHEGPIGVDGPVIVPLAAPTSGSSSGCADVDRELAKNLIQHPSDYYVNVHNADYPAGALRGQL